MPAIVRLRVDLVGGQSEVESRSLAHGRVQPDRSVMPFHDLLRDREPGARAASVRVAWMQPAEHPKDRAPLLLWDPDAVILHVEDGAGSAVLPVVRLAAGTPNGTRLGLGRGREADLDPRRRLVGVLDGVADQIR